MPKEIDPSYSFSTGAYHQPPKSDTAPAMYAPALFTDIEESIHIAQTALEQIVEPDYRATNASRLGIIERDVFSPSYLTYAALKRAGYDIHFAESVESPDKLYPQARLDVFVGTSDKEKVDNILINQNRAYTNYLRILLNRPDQLEPSKAVLPGEDSKALYLRGIATAILVENTRASLLHDTEGVLDADQSLQQYEAFKAQGVAPFSIDELLALASKSLNLE